MQRSSETKPPQPKSPKISIYIGSNGAMMLAIYFFSIIFFMTFYSQISQLYSSVLIAILSSFGIKASITSQATVYTIPLFSGYTEYYIRISNIVSSTFPILMMQKMQFVLVMASLALGLKITPKKKLNYLLVVPFYWGFVMAQDVIFFGIISWLQVQPDRLIYGSLLLLTSSYAGSVIMLYAIFHTADLPKPVKIKPKILRDSTPYYYVAFITIILSVLFIYYILFPFLQNIQYNLSISIVVLLIFSVFRMILYAVGFIFASLDKPLRSYSYAPLVSVLIPAYNEEKIIVGTIQAADLAAEFYRGKVELIVIDDRSTDSTPLLAYETIKNCKHLVGKIITGEGRGKSAAMNLALEHANGELTLNIDADMLLTKDTLHELVPYFVDPEVGGVGCHVDQKDEHGILRKMFALDIMQLFGLVKFSQQGYDSLMVIIGGLNVYRREILQEIGGWGPIKTGDDGDMTLRVARYGYKVLQYNKKSLGYSEIFSDFQRWFIQITRWYLGFFYMHSRNRTAITERQGLRGTFYMPFVYVRTFTRVTTLLYTEIVLIMSVTTLFSGASINPSFFLAIVITSVPALGAYFFFIKYYHKAKIIPYIVFLPVYHYLQMLCIFRALVIAMGDENWETRATVERRVVTNNIDTLSKTLDNLNNT